MSLRTHRLPQGDGLAAAPAATGAPPDRSARGAEGAAAPQDGQDPSTESAWSQQGERGHALLLRLMVWIAVTFGRRLARLVLLPITAYFWLASPSARRHSRRYLQRATGQPAGGWAVARHLHHFASVVLDRVYLVRGGTRGFHFDVEGSEHLDAAVTAGRGAVLLGAHLGSFEALHAAGLHHPGLRVAMVMYPDNARMIQAALKAAAPDAELPIIAIGRPGSTLQIRDWLAGGGLAGLLGDRFLDDEGARQGIVSVPFLGRPARLHDGPLRLAQLLRQKVIFMVALYEGGHHYRVRFVPLADFSERPADAAAREAALKAAMRDYVGLLEAGCRESPLNWFNFYDFWNEDAPEDPAKPDAHLAR